MKILLPIVFIVVFSMTAFGAAFIVNSYADTNDLNTADGLCLDADGNCTLRAAVQQANVLGSNDTINFVIQAGEPRCRAGVCVINLTLGEVTIDSTVTAGTLTINNATGAGNLLISPFFTSRVFYLNTNANLTIKGVTITQGNGEGAANSGLGGGIYNNGILTLTDSTVSDSQSTFPRGSGGGIYNNGGTLTLTNSTVNNNVAVKEDGGGIYNNGGTTTLIGSNISDNRAGLSGGGIYNNSGTAMLTNSTVSGSFAGSAGGGILNDNNGTATLTNSTISGNTANFVGGGGIYNRGTLNLTNVTVTRNKAVTIGCGGCDTGGIRNFATANLKNTIVAGNTADRVSLAIDFGGAVTAESAFNLIGDGSGTTGITNGDANQNQVGSSASPIDPLLDPTLKLNGGTTATHALLPGSPAIDKGNNSLAVDTSNNPLLFDQRGIGFLRIIDGNSDLTATADIGAYEAPIGTTAANAAISGRVSNSKGRGVFRAMVILTSQSGETRTAMTNPFGYYSFGNVESGGSYVLSINAKQVTFTPRTIFVSSDLSNLDFIGEAGR